MSATGSARHGHDGEVIDWASVRDDFPLLRREVHGKPLVYLDSANTSQKPAAVIDAVDGFYRRHNANVSRAVHALGAESLQFIRQPSGSGVSCV